LGIAPEDCLYVGDAERDMQAGRAVGMKTVLVNWGYISADDDTASWQADIAIDHPLQLLQHL
ncbi:HAD family hydrolase, partial [Vogesella oryzae]|uniref:HAD family hydrolase n=1 Tax=Vogesella oryzae TaxID=1735285 RepID=UPI001581A80E